MGDGHTKGGATIMIGGVRVNLHDLLSKLGLTLDQAQLAAGANDVLRRGGTAADVLNYLRNHGGIGGIGPIMLRIGLPRDKLLDLAHILKPLSQHGLIRFFYNGRSISFSQFEQLDSNNIGGATIETTYQNIWLRKTKNLPTNVMAQLLYDLEHNHGFS